MIDVKYHEALLPPENTREQNVAFYIHQSYSNVICIDDDENFHGKDISEKDIFSLSHADYESRDKNNLTIFKINQDIFVLMRSMGVSHDEFGVPWDFNDILLLTYDDMEYFDESQFMIENYDLDEIVFIRIFMRQFLS